MHVLLADGDADIRAVVALSLQQDSFFTLRDCASGAEALRIARKWRPDLVLLDVEMPGMDGPAVLTKMRADGRTAAVPIVFLTARAQAQDRARWKALGAAGVIAKPFDALALADDLRRHVPFEGALAGAREIFLARLADDAEVLAACRRRLAHAAPNAVLNRINAIA